MTELHADPGGKRRLPTWMLGVTTADLITNSKSEDLIKNSLVENCSTEVALPKRKPISRRHEHRASTNVKEALLDSPPLNDEGVTFGRGKISLPKATRKIQRMEKSEAGIVEEVELDFPPDETTFLNVNSSAPVRDEERRRKAKKANHAGDSYIPITSSEVAGSQRKKAKTKSVEGKRTVKKCTKKQRLKNIRSDCSEDISPSATEGSEDDELTVEDLMSMAEEFVKASDEKGCDQKAMQGLESKSEAKNFNVESGGSLQVVGHPQHLSTSTAPCSSSNFVELEKAETDNSASEVKITAIRTGDPAQDMLELLLGPLLKKPQAEEKVFDSIRKNAAIGSDINKLTANENRLGQEAPLSKKKSSLKDKVSVLLEDYD